MPVENLILGSKGYMLYLLKLFAVFKKPFYVSTKVSNSRTTQH